MAFLGTTNTIFVGNIVADHVNSENIDTLLKRLCVLERYCLKCELMPVLPFSEDLIKLIVSFVVEDSDVLPDLVTPPDTPIGSVDSEHVF